VVQVEDGTAVRVGCDRDDGLRALRERLEAALGGPSLDGASLSYGGRELFLGGASPASGPGVRDLPSGLPLLLRTPVVPERTRSCPDLGKLFAGEGISLETSLEEALGRTGLHEDRGPPARSGPGEGGLGSSLPLASRARSCSTTMADALVPPTGLAEALQGMRDGGLEARRRGTATVDLLGGAAGSESARRLVRRVRKGLEVGTLPKALGEGLGGSYVFSGDQGDPVAVIKPFDEEPLAPNNPKGFVGRALGEPGLKPTVRVGEAGLREVAAFLLDREGFARVPVTAIARLHDPVFHYNRFGSASGGRKAGSKVVSIQEYIEHDYDSGECGTSAFPSDAVHRIGILDIRLFNTDRHSGNILVRHHRLGDGFGGGKRMGLGLGRTQSSLEVSKVSKAGNLPNGLGSQAPRGPGGLGPALAKSLHRTTVDLVPIDHGFCLPETLEAPYFEWLHWPQASMPFSQESLEYIQALDARKDAQLLRRELPTLPIECSRVLEVATQLLQRAAAADLCLAEIGMFVSRPLVGMQEEPSELERLCLSAREDVQRALAAQGPTHCPPEGPGCPTNGHCSNGLQGLPGPGTSDEDEDPGDDMFDMDDLAPLSAPGSCSPGSRRQAEHFQEPWGPQEHEPNGFHSVTSLSPSTPSPVSPLMGHGPELQDKPLPRAHTLPWATEGKARNGPQGGLAASVVAGGYMSKAAQFGERKAAGQAGGQKPVSCELPSPEIRGLFSGWDQGSWGHFMRAFELRVDKALRESHWRHGYQLRTKEGTVLMNNFGTSCPEF